MCMSLGCYSSGGLSSDGCPLGSGFFGSGCALFCVCMFRVLLVIYIVFDGSCSVC